MPRPSFRTHLLLRIQPLKTFLKAIRCFSLKACLTTQLQQPLLTRDQNLGVACLGQYQEFLVMRVAAEGKGVRVKGREGGIFLEIKEKMATSLKATRAGQDLMWRHPGGEGKRERENSGIRIRL